MTKLREWLIKLQGQVDKNEETTKFHSEIISWVTKLIVGSVILGILAFIIRTKI